MGGADFLFEESEDPDLLSTNRDASREGFQDLLHIGQLTPALPAILEAPGHPADVHPHSHHHLGTRDLAPLTLGRGA
ncbi:hypothetical protein KH5H1_19760 [Corallococcus caeni]|nr:hypothetical protein KH5H1_19760 [Corallococcus sp. KH5-1]